MYCRHRLEDTQNGLVVDSTASGRVGGLFEAGEITDACGSSLPGPLDDMRSIGRRWLQARRPAVSQISATFASIRPEIIGITDPALSWVNSSYLTLGNSCVIEQSIAPNMRCGRQGDQ